VSSRATHSAKKKLELAVPPPRPRKRETAVKPWGVFDVVAVSLVLLLSSVLTTLILSNHLTALMPEIGQVGVRIVLLLVFDLLVLFVLATRAHSRELPFRAAYGLRVGYWRGAGLAAGYDAAGDDPAAAADQSPLPAGNAAAQDATFAGRGKARQAAWPSWKSALMVVVLFLGLRLVVAGYNFVTGVLAFFPPPAETMTSLFGTNLVGLAGASLTVVLLAPCIEELVFRVIMQQAFARKLPFVAALMVQALIFSLYHLSLWAALPNFLLALCCGWLAWRSKTILPAVVLHVLYNAAVVAAAFYLAAAA
jgi:membrane protease YdiL (CAAX protease family)